MDEAPADLETGDTEEEEVDFIAESQVSEVIQEVVSENIAASRGNRVEKFRRHVKSRLKHWKEKSLLRETPRRVRVWHMILRS